MKTIAILAPILAVAVSAIAQETEKPARREPSISAKSGTLTVDRDERTNTKIFRFDDGSGSGGFVKLERDTDEKSGPKTWLGVVLNEVPAAVASQLPLDPGTGLIVEYVTPDSPAAKAGLQRHDVLVRLGDQVLIAPKQFQTLVANRKAGDTVEIAFLRKGQPQTATATVATHQPGDGLGDHKAAINLYDTKIDLDRLIKDASDTAGSIILNKKTVFVGPDGKPVTIDSDEIRDRTLKMLKESGFAREILEQVKRAISEAQEQVRKAQTQGKQAAEQAAKAAEQAQAAHQALKLLQESGQKPRRNEPSN